MITFEQVCFGYNGTQTVHDVSFHIASGAWTAMLGENGAGKSTIARLCNGLLQPHKGRVRTCGKDTRSVRVSALAGNIAFLFQNPDRQICQPSARAEIMFALDTVVASPEEREERVNDALAAFSLDGESVPFHLSRGERQKIAVASVLARRPAVLILDEPTTGLDDRESRAVMEAVRGLHKKGTTVLMITHDMEIARHYASDSITVKAGRIAA
jgi:energy-coupling factor transport system ATP-binding protein